MEFIKGLIGFLDFLWLTFLLLAPMLLLGLLLCGIMHVFVPANSILRWFREDNLKVVTGSAAIGVPMPLCSCSVVPVVAELRRKGASRSACMSLLITTPETGADSILVTNAFFGPIVAVVRPFVSFLTAVVSGLFCIRLTKDDGPTQDSRQALDSYSARADSETHHHTACHDHVHEHVPLFSDRDECYVSLRDAWVAAKQSITTSLARRSTTSQAPTASLQDALHPDENKIVNDPQAPSMPSFQTVLRHVFRYGFIEVADDILFALLVGITLGGLLYFVVPDDLMNQQLAIWLVYPVMLVIGMPLYICASASTPIAAALVAKGVSPGAALVFLMTGPATNTGTMAIILNQFGARFASIYVLGVVGVTVVLGVAIDVLLIASGISIAVNLEASESHAILSLQWAGAIGLLALIAWRFKAGAMRSGFNDLLVNLRPIYQRLTHPHNRRSA